MSKANNMELLLRQIEQNISEYSSRVEPLQFHWYKYLTPPRQETFCKKVVHTLPPFIEYAKKDFESGNKNKAISNVLYVIEEIFEPIMGQDISWAINTIKDWNKPKYDKEEERESIGYTVATLIFYGSSANQAFDAVSDWLVMSKTKVRDAYYFVRSKGKKITEESIADSYSIGRYLWRLKVSYEEDARPFPKEHIKAFHAFVRASVFLFEAEHYVLRADSNYFDFRERQKIYNDLFDLENPSLRSVMVEGRYASMMIQLGCDSLEDISKIINC